jgi:hypothetical protein
MRRGTIVLLIVLALLLGGAIYYAAQGFLIPGESMPADGYAAMIIGIVLSIAVGCGLMALLFLSSRRGYDDPPRYDLDG